MLATDMVKMVLGFLRSGKNIRQSLQGKMVRRMNSSKTVDLQEKKKYNTVNV